MCATQPIKNLSQNTNVRSQQKTQSSTKATSQKPKRSRDEKRRAWAKKSVPKPQPKKAPERSYTSVCCTAPATKPRAGQKETARDPESGKTKSQPKGLGHWTCGTCHKKCKVTVGKNSAPVGEKISAENEASAIHNFPPAPDCVVATGITIGGPQ